MEWRNDPITISNFRTDRAVTPDEHIRWFAAQLKNPNTFCYIGCEDEIPCGVVWFRKNPSHVLETSVNVAPRFRGMGLSKLMLRGAISAIGLDNNGFSTEIKTTNIPSIKMFEACGYILVFTALGFGTYYRPKWQTWLSE
jgi:L-amino acid N-acyltransferase YncA